MVGGVMTNESDEKAGQSPKVGSSGTPFGMANHHERLDEGEAVLADIEGPKALKEARLSAQQNRLAESEPRRLKGLRMPKGNDWKFNRGLDQQFIDALRDLANDPQSWFAEVLHDTELTIGIRDNYINVYADGQSLFMAKWTRSKPHINVSTHPKYLLRSSLNKPVSFDGETFDISSADPLWREYQYGKTLGDMKRAARLYSGVEKEGVQMVVQANRCWGSENQGHSAACVIDLEIALSKQAEQEDADEEQGGAAVHTRRATAQRVDIACFEEIGDSIHLCFWEAKDYGNAELWAAGSTPPPVTKQVREYQELIKQYEPHIKKSYRRVACNLASIAEMAGQAGWVSPLIQRVRDGEEFVIDDPAKVGVVIYGFSAAERDGERHKSMLKKLKEDASLAVAIRGNAKGMKLRSSGHPPIP
jgi:hypothetical protein